MSAESNEIRVLTNFVENNGAWSVFKNYMCSGLSITNVICFFYLTFWGTLAWKAIQTGYLIDCAILCIGTYFFIAVYKYFSLHAALNIDPVIGTLVKGLNKQDSFLGYTAINIFDFLEKRGSLNLVYVNEMFSKIDASLDKEGMPWFISFCRNALPGFSGLLIGQVIAYYTLDNYSFSWDTIFPSLFCWILLGLNIAFLVDCATDFTRVHFDYVKRRRVCTLLIVVRSFLQQEENNTLVNDGI